MIRQKDFIETVERRIDCRHLNQNIRTVRIFFYHALHTSDLPFNPAQAVDHVLVFLFRTLFRLMTVTTFFLFFHASHLFFSLYDGYYIPHWGILQGKFFSFRVCIVKLYILYSQKVYAFLTCSTFSTGCFFEIFRLKKNPQGFPPSWILL